jgi:hypothetical protein
VRGWQFAATAQKGASFQGVALLIIRLKIKPEDISIRLAVPLVVILTGLVGPPVDYAFLAFRRKGMWSLRG